MRMNGLPRVKRVAVIAYHTSPLDEPGVGDAGGMTIYVRALACALSERGVSTDIFTRAISDIGRIVELAPGVRVISVEAGPVGRLEKERQPQYIGEFIAGVRAFATAQRIRYDLVHSHYWQSGLAAKALAGAWGVTMVHSHHSLGRVKNRWLAPGDAPEPQTRLDGELDVISSADVLVASTEEEWEQLACLYGAPHDRLKTLHPGVDHRLFSPGSRAAARAQLGLEPDLSLLLYVGRIQRLKGLDLAITSLDQIVGSLDNAHLVVVGGASGPGGDKEVDRLAGLAEALGVEDRVSFVGPRRHDALPTFYRAADVLVVCSHTESFGLTALEAHACGIPVVGTSVGGLSHIVSDGASVYLVGNRDPSVFAARLKTLLSDAELRRRFSSEALKRSSVYSWGAVADGFMELYECLLREEFPEVCSC